MRLNRNDQQLLKDGKIDVHEFFRRARRSHQRYKIVRALRLLWSFGCVAVGLVLMIYIVVGWLK